MKRLNLILIVAFGISILVGCSKPIVIGYIDNMTGFSGRKGKEFMMAAQIAIEEKNKLGGIKGHKFVLKAVDTEGNLNKALSAMDNFIAQKVFAVIGGPELAEKAQNAKIPLMIVNSRDKVNLPSRDYIFRNVLSYEHEAKVFAKYVYNVMNIKKLAILAVTNSYGLQIVENFKNSYIEEGGVIAIEKYIHHIEDPYSDESDFKEELNAIKGKADVIFIPNPAIENQRILISADELNMKVKFISTSSYADPDVFTEARNLANGVYFSNIPEDLTESTPAREKYEKAFEAKFKLTPSFESINSYDAVRLLIAAIEKTYEEASPEEKASLKLNPEKLKENILNTKDFEGTMLKLSVLPNGEVNKEVGIFKSEFMGFVQQAVYILQDGKLVQVK